jgi:hypothetical protein
LLLSQERFATVSWEPQVTSGFTPCDGLITLGSASDAALDTGPFTASVVVDRSVTVETGYPPIPTFDCVSESWPIGVLDARHDSLDVDLLTASGGHDLAPQFFYWADFSQEVRQDTNAEAVYRVRFQLTEPTHYELDGTVTHGAVLGSSSGRFSLRGPLDVTLFDFRTGDSCGQIDCPPELIRASGVIPPGIYEFDASTSGSAATRYDFFGNDGASHADFQVTLIFDPAAVPGLAAGALFGLVSSLAVLGARALRGRASWRVGFGGCTGGGFFRRSDPATHRCVVRPPHPTHQPGVRPQVENPLDKASRLGTG